LPNIVKIPRTESIRAVVVGPYDEDRTLFEYQPNEPQFIEHLDTNKYEKETIELLGQIPSQHHNYLDIFRKREVPRLLARSMNHSIGDRNHSIADRNHSIADRNHSIADRNHSIADHSHSIADHSHSIADHNLSISDQSLA